MRILHTSDWHLGRTLHGVDLIEAQAQFLDHLVATVAEQSVDLVVVAGDIYDRAVPPIEAVRLLESALIRLCEHTRVLVLSGNHDSATRLGFGSALFTPRLHVHTDPRAVGMPVELSDAHGPVLVYPIPYLDPDQARHLLASINGQTVGARSVAADAGPGSADAGALVEPLARSHEAVMGAATGRIRRDVASRSGGPRPRTVAVAHAFVIGGEPSESERDIRVGGVDAIAAGVFDGLDYVALGHLHGPQTLASRPDGTQLRYAGSPLAYSFSEAGHHKSSWLVDLDATGVSRVEPVPAPVPRRLSTVRATLDSLLAAGGEPHLANWVRVVVTDPVRPVELVPRLKARFPHVLLISHEPHGGRVPGQGRTLPVAGDPRQVAVDFLAYTAGREPVTAETDVLSSAYDLALAAERSA